MYTRYNMKGSCIDLFPIKTIDGNKGGARRGKVPTLEQGVHTRTLRTDSGWVPRVIRNHCKKVPAVCI